MSDAGETSLRGDDTPKEPEVRPARSGSHSRRGRRRRFRRRAHRSWHQRLAIATCLAMMAGCLFAASGLTYTITRVDQIQRIPLPVDFENAPRSPPGAAKNFLLVGVDSTKGLAANDPIIQGRQGEQNSDTIIILRVDPANKAMSMLSLPRDLWVPIGGPRGSKSKINSALPAAGGKPDLLIKTITDSLGIRVDHYVQIDLNGFRQLIDAIGGVPMEFKYPTQDPETGLYQPVAGCVPLDATQALGFVRTRKMQIIRNGRWVPDGGDDLARAKRQQELIRAAMKKAITLGARNPAVLNGMIGVGLQNVAVDNTLTIGDLLDLASHFRDFDPATINSYEPFVTDARLPGVSALALNERDSQPIFEIFRGHNPLEDVRPFVRVEVRSSTGERDKAKTVGLELALSKFSVTATRDDNQNRGKPSRILYATDDDKISAVILARYLDLNVPIEKGVLWAGDSRIALIVGADYAGLRSDARPLTDFRAYLPPGMLPDENAPKDPNSPTTTATLAFAIPTSTIAGEIPTAPQGCG